MSAAVLPDFASTERATLSSTPTASFKEQGALAGKVIYLSPGHGFTWETGVTPNSWMTQRGTTNEIVEDLVSTETVNQFLVPMLLNEFQKQQRMIEAQAAEIAELRRLASEMSRAISKR